MHPGLKRMLTQTVRVQSPAGMSDFGGPSWGPEVTIPARVEATTKIVIVGDGQAYQASHLVIAEGGIKVGDRVWRPGQAEPDTAKSVLEIPEPFTERIDHIEVYL